MTKQNKSTLTNLFETGDTPDGSNYADLIDSSVNAAETSAQSMAGDLSVPNLTVSGIVTANQILADNITVSAALTAGTATILGAVTADSVTVSGAVCAASVFADNVTVSANLTADGLTATTVSAADVFITSAMSFVTAMTTATPSAGAGAAVPASAAKFLKIEVSGVSFLVALYGVG